MSGKPFPHRESLSGDRQANSQFHTINAFRDLSRELGRCRGGRPELLGKSGKSNLSGTGKDTEEFARCQDGLCAEAQNQRRAGAPEWSVAVVSVVADSQLRERRQCLNRCTMYQALVVTHRVFSALDLDSCHRPFAT